MFLQIVMREQDRRFQRILYRFDPRDPVSVFEFSRVCFGLKSSPYHALRVVQQLIADEGPKFPMAMRSLVSDHDTDSSLVSNEEHENFSAARNVAIYMDDIVISVLNESQAVITLNELIRLFKSGQFDLVKWTSNSNRVMEAVPASHRASPDLLEFDKSAEQKILGLHWDRSNDCFFFRVNSPDERCTKRTMLSAIARLWDIAGFVAPIILYTKLLIKELWLSKVEWDETPPPHIVEAWEQFCAELPALNRIRIPRHLGVVEGCVVNLIGFADASERAYGCAVYLHIRIGTNTFVQLVCAKSKVSPMKPLSIARLELCAALLLARLLRLVYDNFNSRYKINKIYAFTDSKVALCWISGSPHRWQTFVANRVVKITENIPASCFYHVAGVDNPADCLSRGLTPSKLIDHPLWFHGPPWISCDPSEWPLRELDSQSIGEVPEQKALAHPVTINAEESVLYKLAQRVSSWSKLLRIIVYIFRFLERLKLLPRRSDSISELEFAEIKLIRVLQIVHFSNDIHNIRANKPCSPALVKLKPFLDENGLIRVGGRLSNSDLSFSEKHPYVLPRRDHIVDLLIDYYHKKHLHAGPELLMSLLRQAYWIFSARRSIRHCIHKCNTCYRHKPRPTYPIMADLPSPRVNQVEKAFTFCGCDYLGPIQYTPTRGRGIKSRKAWICVFTCLTTRALHIEVATDLTTVSFINALKRFLSRRGPVRCMYSDRGTNFVGARSYLRDLYKFLHQYRSSFEQELTENRINWKFIPPSAPHFAGSWESMVKIVKNHFFKVVGQQILSYEELITVLTQVEALINSRPLTALSSDPAEPRALTPAHFINTSPLLSMPAPQVESVNLLERHSLLDRMVQSFWRRWRVEYLHQLQSRSKWNIPSVPIREGTVVIIVTDNAPPFSWPLAIVESIHPSDGVIRVVTLRTSKGRLVRPVVKLCPLPNQ